MSSPEDPVAGTGADDTRSGDDVTEAVDVAEQGSRVEQPHDRSASAADGPAPIERAAGDPEMTEGQVVLGEGQAETPGDGVDPRETAGSGGAQSQPGPRISDRESAGQPPPEGPPFD